jgi:caffeoyl-CoA O-methyltransferase
MSKETFKNVEEYINGLFVKEDQALLNVSASIEEAGIPAISVSANQGKFLHLLAKIVNAKKILEMGTLAGYSTIWMARALPPEGQLITLEFDPMHAEVAKKNLIAANVDAQVDIRIGKALDLLPKIEAAGEGPFDMIFIDADKPPYTEYFQWAVRLSRPGTLIVTDNVIRDGKVLDENSDDENVIGVRRFNEMLAGNKAVSATIIQTVGEKDHDGMALAIVG